MITKRLPPLLRDCGRANWVQQRLRRRSACPTTTLPSPRCSPCAVYAANAAGQPRPLRLGTRGSPLALAQAYLARDLLQAHDPGLAEAGALEVVPIETAGDRNQGQALGEIVGAGAGGLFTQDIDEALLEGRVDVAVHSMKDVPVRLPPGLALLCTLPRQDVRDAFISHKALSLAGLPPGAVVGTSSTRRRAQILARHPHLKVETLRGSVQARLRRLEEGACAATLLALAGLRRLGMEGRATSILSTEEMLPAAGQGAIGLVCREGDERAAAALAAISHEATWLAVACERAFLAALGDGTIRGWAVAALAQEDAGGRLAFRGLVGRPDGSRLYEAARVGSMAEADAAAMGGEAGQELLRNISSLP